MDTKLIVIIFAALFVLLIISACLLSLFSSWGKDNNSILSNRSSNSNESNTNNESTNRRSNNNVVNDEQNSVNNENNSTVNVSTDTPTKLNVFIVPTQLTNSNEDSHIINNILDSDLTTYWKPQKQEDSIYRFKLQTIDGQPYELTSIKIATFGTNEYSPPRLIISNEDSEKVIHLSTDTDAIQTKPVTDLTKSNSFVIELGLPSTEKQPIVRMIELIGKN